MGFINNLKTVFLKNFNFNVVNDDIDRAYIDLKKVIMDIMVN